VQAVLRGLHVVKAAAFRHWVDALVLREEKFLKIDRAARKWTQNQATRAWGAWVKHIEIRRGMAAMAHTAVSTWKASLLTRAFSSWVAHFRAKKGLLGRVSFFRASTELLNA
jgi:hypothetical protein